MTSDSAWGAAVNSIDAPAVMNAGQAIPIEVHVRNESDRPWGVAGADGADGEALPVRLSYHWLRADGGTTVFEGVRTDLPHALAPGEALRCFATVAAPSEPGDYVLEWDLVVEYVRWFSAAGWPAPTVAVTVIAPPGPGIARRLDLAAIVARVAPYSMVPYRWLLTLAQQVCAVLDAGVPGHFVECGVWRGGAAFLMAEILRQSGATGRTVYLFDSFAGLPPPGEEDGPVAHAYAADAEARWDHCRASLDEVRAAARALDLEAYTACVPGWFDVTIPATRDRVGPIALLRVDGDWYASVTSCLEGFYDQIAPGGIVVLDDYHTWPGCTRAVHAFLTARALPHAIETTEAGVAFFRKAP